MAAIQALVDDVRAICDCSEEDALNHLSHQNNDVQAAVNEHFDGGKCVPVSTRALPSTTTAAANLQQQNNATAVRRTRTQNEEGDEENNNKAQSSQEAAQKEDATQNGPQIPSNDAVFTAIAVATNNNNNNHLTKKKSDKIQCCVCFEYAVVISSHNKENDKEDAAAAPLREVQEIFNGIFCNNNQKQKNNNNNNNNNNNDSHFTCRECLSSYIIDTWSVIDHSEESDPILRCPACLLLYGKQEEDDEDNGNPKESQQEEQQQQDDENVETDNNNNNNNNNNTVSSSSKSFFEEYDIAQNCSKEAFEKFFEVKRRAHEAATLGRACELFANGLLFDKNNTNNNKKSIMSKGEKEILQRQLKLQFGDKALMCPKCKLMCTFADCADLKTHHGESRGGGAGKGIVSNACEHCGFFSIYRDDWEKWDGILREAHELTAKRGEFTNVKCYQDGDNNHHQNNNDGNGDFEDDFSSDDNDFNSVDTVDGRPRRFCRGCGDYHYAHTVAEWRNLVNAVKQVTEQGNRVASYALREVRDYSVARAIDWILGRSAEQFKEIEARSNSHSDSDDSNEESSSSFSDDNDDEEETDEEEEEEKKSDEKEEIKQDQKEEQQQQEGKNADEVRLSQDSSASQNPTVGIKNNSQQEKKKQRRDQSSLTENDGTK